jgi:hypothetical protein
MSSSLTTGHDAACQDEAVCSLELAGLACEQVDFGGHRAVDGQPRNGGLKPGQHLLGVWLDVERRAGHEVGEDPIARQLDHRQADCFNENDELIKIEPAKRPVGAGGSVAMQDVFSCFEPAGQHPSEHGCGPVSGKQAKNPGRPQRGGSGGKTCDGIVGKFEYVMAEQDIRLLWTDDLGKRIEITLPGADPRADPCLTGATLEGRQ